MSVLAERVTVTDVATALNALPSGTVTKMSVVVTNKDATDAICVGPSDVTFAAGYRLPAGESVSVDLPYGERLYGIADTGNTVVCDVLRTGA